MAEQRPTAEFATNVGQTFKMKFDKPYKSGENQYGNWHLWTMSDEHGVDVSLFAKDPLNALLLSSEPFAGMDVYIIKAQAPGDKAPHYELSKAVEGQWVPVEAPDEPVPAPVPQDHAPVPGPTPPQAPAAPTPPSAAQKPPPKSGVTIHAAGGCMEDCVAYVQGIVQRQELTGATHDQILVSANCLFIGVTKGNLVIPQAISTEEAQAAFDAAVPPTPDTAGPEPPLQDDSDLPFE